MRTNTARANRLLEEVNLRRARLSTACLASVRLSEWGSERRRHHHVRSGLVEWSTLREVSRVLGIGLEHELRLWSELLRWLLGLEGARTCVVQEGKLLGAGAGAGRGGLLHWLLLLLRRGVR